MFVLRNSYSFGRLDSLKFQEGTGTFLHLSHGLVFLWLIQVQRKNGSKNFNAILGTFVVIRTLPGKMPLYTHVATALHSMKIIYLATYKGIVSLYKQ